MRWPAWRIVDDAPLPRLWQIVVALVLAALFIDLGRTILLTIIARGMTSDELAALLRTGKGQLLFRGLAPFAWLMALPVATVAVAFQARRRIFGWLAVLSSVAVALVVSDFALRFFFVLTRTDPPFIDLTANLRWVAFASSIIAVIFGALTALFLRGFAQRSYRAPVQHESVFE